MKGQQSLYVLIILYVEVMLLGRYQATTVPRLLDEIFDGYDKRLPPKYNLTGFDKQVTVDVNMYINSMFSISETSMDYSMSMFLRERWIDERLAYDNVVNLTRLELDANTMGKVWIPDMYILNEKSSNFHEVTVPNKLMHVYPDGTVQYSMRVTGTYSCKMDLQKYPFDKQICNFEVESYGYSTESLRFKWTESAVTVAKGFEFPQFELTDTDYYSCEKDYYGIIYPCVGVRFYLSRSYGYYLTQIYVPSVLIVLLSWVNFWLDPTSTPARISLGLLTVLTITTQSSGARANLPPVSYVKAIDVWMAVCLTFVFAALVEFACVNVTNRGISRKDKTTPRKATKNDEKNDKKNGQVDVSEINIEVGAKTKIPCFKNMSGIDRARLLDKISRVLFPVIFLIFNAVYWMVYFLWEPDLLETV